MSVNGFWLGVLAGQTAGVSPSRFLVLVTETGNLAGNQVAAYEWSDETGFGVTYADPAGYFEGSYATACDVNLPGSAVIFSPRDQGSQAWAWAGTGFGAKYAGVMGGGAPDSTLFAPDNAAVAQVQGTTLVARAWSDASGFGATYANPSPFMSSIGMAFSNNADALLFQGRVLGTPYAAAYAWDSAAGFGTQFANPSPLPGPASEANLSGSRPAFSPSDDAVALPATAGKNQRPAVDVYGWSASGFGARYADPAEWPGMSEDLEKPGLYNEYRTYAVRFSPLSNAIAWAADNQTEGAVGLYAWAWDSGSGYGAKFADVAPVSIAMSRVEFSATGDSIVASQLYGPNLYAYPFSAAGFGTQFAQPAAPSHLNRINDISLGQ